MKNTPVRTFLAVLSLSLCSCIQHSAYYNTISRNLDIARTQGKISEENYFKSRMQLEAMEEQRIARIRMALGGMAANASAQIQANQARQDEYNRALVLQGMRNATAQPRTYDSTVRPTYPGGPTYVHTEQTGGY